MYSVCSKSAGTKTSNRSRNHVARGLGYSLAGRFGKQPLTRGGPHNSSATLTEVYTFSTGLSPELQSALEPLLAAIESLSERIREYNEQIEELAQQA